MLTRRNGINEKVSVKLYLEDWEKLRRLREERKISLPLIITMDIKENFNKTNFDSLINVKYDSGEKSNAVKIYMPVDMKEMVQEVADRYGKKINYILREYVHSRINEL